MPTYEVVRRSRDVKPRFENYPIRDSAEVAFVKDDLTQFHGSWI